MRLVFNFFKTFFPKKIVGVDIGASAIKIVEISVWGETKKLENYGEAKLDFISQGNPAGVGKIDNAASGKLVSAVIKEILSEAKIKSRKAIFSVSDSSVFCTSFDIPPMLEKEIAGAIRYNASQYITLPISEVALDWRIIPNSASGGKPALKVFVVAISNQIVQECQDTAKNAGLELRAVEAEVFGITKALIKSSEKTICLIDIGAESSTINIVDKKHLKRSYSFGFNSVQLTNAVSSTMGIDYNRAEEIKNKEGLNSPEPAVVHALCSLVDLLLAETRNVSSEFLQMEQKQVDEVYLTGGAANLPGLKEYLAKNLKKNVSIPDCFSEILHPEILGETIKEIGPRFSAAVGVALDGLEI